MASFQRFLCFGILIACVPAQAGCFYYGSSTVYKVRHITGGGYLYAVERQGQWDTQGPPPQAGEITQRPLFGKLQQSATYSTNGTSHQYAVSDPLPFGRYLITSIREVGAAHEGQDTVHYYEVQFAQGAGSIH